MESTYVITLYVVNCNVVTYVDLRWLQKHPPIFCSMNIRCSMNIMIDLYNYGQIASFPNQESNFWKHEYFH